MRCSRGMTQEQLGLLTGMSKSQISRMEHGKLGGPETYSRITRALGFRVVINYIDERPGNKFDRSAVISLLKSFYICNKDALGITRMGLFGSFARNEANSKSDIDIIVSLKKPTLYKYSSLNRQLEKIFDRKVDLIPSSSNLSESFKEQIEKDVIYVSE